MRGWTTLSLTVAWLAIAAPVRAQVTSDAWQFTLTPYAWAAGVRGDVTLADRTGSFDVSAGDLLSSLDFGFMLAFEARNGDWAGNADFLYTSLGKDVQVGLPPGDRLSLGPFALDVDQLIVAADVSYRVANGLEVLAGVRGVDASTSLAGQRGRIVEGEEGWVDPLVGLRFRRDLGERWRLTLRGDVGGFGVGSEIALFGSVAIAYQATDWLSLAGGYRLWDFDYEGQDAVREFDATLSGFGAGVSFHF